MNKKLLVILLIGILLTTTILLIFITKKNNVKQNSNSIIQSSSKKSVKEKTDKIEEISGNEPVEKLGSAKEIKGTTVIVSIFTNDLNTSFNFLDEKDAALKSDCLDNLKIASQYLEGEIKNYGFNSKFIYDFNINNDLIYETSFKENLVLDTSEKYDLQNTYIKENIPVDKLLKKYKADNIIYFFFFNTPYQNKVKPVAMRYTNEVHIENEIINLYIKFGDVYTSPPATYAHEILHTFGAHDLYVVSKNINASYVSYLASIDSNDIMYTVANSKEITNNLSDLDAYYVGLKNESMVQKKWDLAPSEH